MSGRITTFLSWGQQLQEVAVNNGLHVPSVDGVTEDNMLEDLGTDAAHRRVFNDGFSLVPTSYLH